MTMRRTPYERIRYPFASDVVSAGDVASTASDIDQALVTTTKMANDYSKFASVIAKRTAAQSIAKGVLTAITFDLTPPWNNGANSPLSNGAWFSGSNPTRLTAPVPCVVAAIAQVGLNISGALGVNGVLQCTVALNGATGQPNVQGSKYSPVPVLTGQQWVNALTLWRLAAGDFLELKFFWTGTPAGPMNTDTFISPQLSLVMLGLLSVP